jgi:serine/threonine protein kinase
MTERIGDQLGNYQLVRLLGQGGFADVYLGEHIHLKSLAAIKVLYTRLTDELRENFLNEARILARLTHPHIIHTLEFGLEANGVPFLVMDYASQGTIRQRHPSGIRVPLATVVEYVRQVADGLQYAHDQKLIHRDLKPDNLLIGANSELLLSDFGVAIVSQTTTRSQTAEKGIIGTMAYMAPEQLQGKAQRASDQYGLGIMAYEWLCGTRPFQGTVIEVFNQHLSVPPTPLREHIPELSPLVEQVVLKALEKDPARRFASVKEFALALEQANQGEVPTFISARTVLPLANITQSDIGTAISDRAGVPPIMVAPAQLDSTIAAYGYANTPTPAAPFPTMAAPYNTTAPELHAAVPSAPVAGYSAPPTLIAPNNGPAPLFYTPSPPFSPPVNVSEAAGSRRKQPSTRKTLLLVGLLLLVILGASTAALYSLNRRGDVGNPGIANVHTNGTQSNIAGNTSSTGNNGSNNSGSNTKGSSNQGSNNNGSSNNNSSGGSGSTPQPTATSVRPTATSMPPTATPIPPKPTVTPTPKPPPGCTIYTDWTLHPDGGTTGSDVFTVSGNCGGVVSVTPAPGSSVAYPTQMRAFTTGGYYGPWVNFTPGSWSVLLTGMSAGTQFKLQAHNVGSANGYTITGNVKY